MNQTEYEWEKIIIQKEYTLKIMIERMREEKKHAFHTFLKICFMQGTIKRML